MDSMPAVCVSPPVWEFVSLRGRSGIIASLHTFPLLFLIISVSHRMCPMTFSFYNSNQKIPSLPDGIVVKAVNIHIVGDHERLKRTMLPEPRLQIPYQSLFIHQTLSVLLAKVQCCVEDTSMNKPAPIFKNLRI